MLKRILLTTVATTLLSQMVVFAADTGTDKNVTNEAVTYEKNEASSDQLNAKPKSENKADVVEKKVEEKEEKTTETITKKVVKADKENAEDQSLANPEKEKSKVKSAAPASSNVTYDIPKDVAQESQQDIKEVMAKAYIYNKLLGAERENVKITDENVSESISEWMPTVSASGERGKKITMLKGDDSYDRVNDTADSKSLNLSLPLFDGFRSYSRYKREKSNVEAARARLKTIEQQVLLNSVVAYMNVEREKESLRLAREKEQALRKHYDDTQARFDLGEITQTDVSQSYTRLTRAITDRMEAEGAYESAKVVYLHIVGEEPTGLYLNVEDPLAAEEINNDKLIAEALMNNPDIDVAELNLKAAGYDVTNKKSALLPSVALRAGKSWREGGYLGSGINEQDEKEVMFNVTVPIYQGGVEYSRVRRAKNTEAKLRYDLEERQNTVREGLVRAIHNYKVSVSSIEVHQANVKTAESALAGLKHEVQVGVRTTVDMLDAEQELYEARLLLLRAKRDKIVNAYALLEQLGRLDAEKQKLNVAYYDPKKYYNKMKYKVVGF